MNWELNIICLLFISSTYMTFGQRRSVITYDVPERDSKFTNINTGSVDKSRNERKETKDNGYSSVIDPRRFSVIRLDNGHNESSQGILTEERKTIIIREQEKPTRLDQNVSVFPQGDVLSNKTQQSSINRRPFNDLPRSQPNEGFKYSSNDNEEQTKTIANRFESSMDINKNINYDSRNHNQNSRSIENFGDARSHLNNSEMKPGGGELNIRQYGKSAIFNKAVIQNDQDDHNFNVSEIDISQYGRSLNIGISSSTNQEQNQTLQQNSPADVDVSQYGRSLNIGISPSTNQKQNQTLQQNSPADVDVSQYGRSLNIGISSSTNLEQNQTLQQNLPADVDVSQYGRSLNIGISSSTYQEQNQTLQQNSPADVDVSQYGRSLNTGIIDHKANSSLILKNPSSTSRSRPLDISSTEKTIFDPSVNHHPLKSFSDNQNKKRTLRNETRLPSVDPLDNFNLKLESPQERPIFQSSKDIIESQIYLNDGSSRSLQKTGDKVAQYPVFDPRKNDGTVIRPNERKGTVH